MQKTLEKPRPSALPLRFVTSQRDTAAQLGLNSLVTTAIGIGLYVWIQSLGVPQPYPLLIALASSCLLGLLFTLNLQYNLYLLELTLSHLAHDGLSVETSTDNPAVSSPWRWPLAPLFARLRETIQRVQHYAEHERLTSDLREKTLQQTSEAAAQAERNRIARELHDSIKQQIFSISVSAAAARAHWQGEQSGNAREAVEDIQRSAKEAQVEMQALLQQLRPAPLENTSLVEALRVQAQALGFRTGAQVHVEIGEMPTNEELLPGTSEAVFRLVQEAFANIAKHARARTVWLSLQRVGASLRVEVRDDGLGFDLTQAPKGMGLGNLRERARELRGEAGITSQPGQGTSVVITLPLLEALSSPAEEARQAYTLARALELARGGYQLGENAAFLGMALIILTLRFDIHWLAVVLGVLVALYGCIRGSYYRIQVALHSGPNSQIALELRRQEYRVYLNFVRLIGVALWYAFNYLGLLNSMTGWWLLAALLMMLTAIIQMARRRYYVDTERYYALLPTQELSWELERRRQGLTRSLTVWFLVIATGLITSYKLLFPPVFPLTLTSGTAYGIALFLLLMGIGMFAERLQIQRWREKIASQAQSATQSTPEENELG